ncbi:hypothetical protein DSO57_1030430 [Entomophthora muscae]|uniref:Uncharacterized protein n=1 Tax=Entomophthora muscae TaxID=34485 RepID=A0ACC2TYU6_9FUNG|nr:hypothetical protein DSO57_1030430 [Entomophthora muscae]
MKFLLSLIACSLVASAPARTREFRLPTLDDLSITEAQVAGPTDGRTPVGPLVRGRLPLETAVSGLTQLSQSLEKASMVTLSKRHMPSTKPYDDDYDSDDDSDDDDDEGPSYSRKPEPMIEPMIEPIMEPKLEAQMEPQADNNVNNKVDTKAALGVEPESAAIKQQKAKARNAFGMYKKNGPETK